MSLKNSPSCQGVFLLSNSDSMVQIKRVLGTVASAKNRKKIPLYQQLHADQFVDERKQKQEIHESSDEEEEHLTERDTRVILTASRQQKLEIENKSDASSSDSDSGYEDLEDLAVDLSEHDQQILAQFEKANFAPGKLLERIQLQAKAPESRPPPIDTRITEAFKKIGLILSRYKSGKLPKAFKALPSLKNWECVLEITEPSRWSPNAVLYATKIFISSLNSRQTQRFFEAVLYPRFRDEMHGPAKKVSLHVYQALKKAVYKPAAFFKGLVLPLAEDGNTTLREALVIASVLTRTSIPPLHSCAALLQLVEGSQWSGVSSILMRAILDKKYAMPYRVIDSLVKHFCCFQSCGRELPVLWHQCLLIFCQRYKNDLLKSQVAAIKELISSNGHHQISSECLRELEQSAGNREK